MSVHQHAPITFNRTEISTFYAAKIPRLRVSDHAEWRCACPIHHGSRDSFAINAVTGQWFCHSDCGRGGGLIDLEMELTGAPFLEAKKRVYEIIGSTPPPKVEPITRRRRPDWMKIAKYYPYQALDKTALYQVVRLEGINPETGKREKEFSQRYPDTTAGKWIWKEPSDEKKVLYRWPDWAKHTSILITEGEKNADSLWGLELPATCALGGSGRAWLPKYTEMLKGMRVAIFQDNDPENKNGKRPGPEWSLKVAKALHKAGIFVKLLPVVPFEPDNPHGQDVSDWIEAGATRSDIIEFIRNTPEFVPPSDEPEPAPDPNIAVQEAIRKAISENDLAGVYRQVPGIATWPHPELMVLVAELTKEFGRGFSKRDLTNSIKAHRAEERAKQQKDRYKDGPLPSVIVNNRPVRDITEDGLKALRLANNPPTLFVRSGEPVYIWRDERDRPFVGTATIDHLRGRLDRSANYVRVTDDGDLHIPVPMDVVKDIGSLPSEMLGLPHLSAVVEAPTIRPDGTIIDQPGFDERTGMYYIPTGLDMRPVPDCPTSEDIEAALGWLDEAVYDFPFVDNASKANLMGLMLTMILRPAITSCVPMALIDAPDFGTGKTYLVNLVSMIAVGQECPMTTLPNNEEEMRKQLAASLVSGRPIICFDNVTGVLNSPSLALALTAAEYETRQLGVTKNIRLPNKSVWIATGNNIRPGGDLPRRCFRVRMDADTPEPFRNRTFRHVNLLEWALENRGELLHSLLVIARAWYTSGSRRHVTRPLGSFGDWHQTVGSILQHVGIEGFLDNFDDTIAQDEDSVQWENFLTTLQDIYQDREFTVVEVIDAIRMGNDTLKNAMPDFLAEAYAKSADGTRRKLGNAFGRIRDRKFGQSGIRIVKAGRSGENTRASEWKVKVG